MSARIEEIELSEELVGQFKGHDHITPVVSPNALALTGFDEVAVEGLTVILRNRIGKSRPGRHSAYTVRRLDTETDGNPVAVLGFVVSGNKVDSERLEAARVEAISEANVVLEALQNLPSLPGGASGEG